MLESENSQVPRINPPTVIREGVSFGEAAQKAFVATEEIFHEPHPVAPSPSPALVQDPLLSADDFTVEQASLASLGINIPLRQTTPAEFSTQPPPGSRHLPPSSSTTVSSRFSYQNKVVASNLTIS